MKRKTWFLVFVPLLAAIALWHGMCLNLAWQVWSTGMGCACIVALVTPITAVLTCMWQPVRPDIVRRHLYAALLAYFSIAVAACVMMGSNPSPETSLDTQGLGIYLLTVELLSMGTVALAARLVETTVPEPIRIRG